MNTRQFVNRHNIRMTSEWTDSNPNNPEWTGANHFKCTLRCGRRQLTTPYSQGYAHSGEPDVASVLDCLALDAAGYENSRSFEEWCSEYGYDTDSRKAERIYRAVEKQTAGLKRLLGERDFEILLYQVERAGKSEGVG